MQPMPNDAVQPDPGKREVIYGQATDIGWFSGKHKRRLKLSDKSKRFAVALFEPNEIKFNDRNKTWVQLTDVGEEAIYADISSLSRRLGISKEKIIKLANEDLIDGKHRLEDKIQKKIGKFFALQKFVSCFSNKNLIKNLSEKEIEVISKYLKDEKSPKNEIRKSQELAKEIIENKKSKKFKKRDIRKFQGLAKDFNESKLIAKDIENTLAKIAKKLTPEEFKDDIHYQGVLGSIAERLSADNFKAVLDVDIEKINDIEIKELWRLLVSLIDRYNLNLRSIKGRMDMRLLDAFFEKLPFKDIVFLKEIEQPLPEKAREPEKIRQNSRVWCDTRLVRSEVDKLVRVKLIDDPNVDRKNTYDIKTDGFLYYARPELTDDFVPYTRDGKTWMRLDIQDLSTRLLLEVEDIREEGRTIGMGLSLLVKERLDYLLAMQERFTEVIDGIKKGATKEKLVRFCNEIKNLEGSDTIVQLAEDLYGSLNNPGNYLTVIKKFVDENLWWIPRTRLTKKTISPFKFSGFAISKALPVVPYGDGFKPSEGKEAVRLNLFNVIYLDRENSVFPDENNPFAIETDGYIYHQKPISTESHVACKIQENAWVLLSFNSLINRTSLYPTEVMNLALRDNENGNSDSMHRLIYKKVIELRKEQAFIKSIIEKSMLIDQEFEAKGEKVIDLWTDKINGMEYEKFLTSLVNDVQSLSLYKDNQIFKDRADQLLRSLKTVTTRSSFKQILGELRQLVQMNDKRH